MENIEQGEFGFIENISKIFSQIKTGKYEGIGDDCSVIPISKDESIVVTTDMLVENTHFIRNKISAYNLGWKSLAVNISDVASMGATPFASFMSIAIPKEVNQQWKAEFIEGYYDISKKFSTELLGGDTTSSQKDIVINITALGIVKNKNIKRRAAAKIGDLVVVTSTLGDSACGLKLILNNLLDLNLPDHSHCESQHHKPSPHTEQGKWLGKQPVNAMMDISDGVSSDLRHICKASSCGATIEISKIPISKEVESVCLEQGWKSSEIALSGGEDYSLLFTIAKQDFEKTSNDYFEFFNQKLYVIGEITSGNEIEYVGKDSEITNIPIGYRHF